MEDFWGKQSSVQPRAILAVGRRHIWHGMDGKELKGSNVYE